MHLVVGLGNPGDRYRDTRHNLGFLVVDALCDLAGASAAAPETDPDWWARETLIEGSPALLVKPLTFMNRSGPAVRRALAARDLDTSGLLVVVDDVALPLGRIRIRPQGSHGGHNGLRSIEEALGTRDYVRVRVGAGPVPEGADLAEFVLSNFPSRDILIVRRAVGRAAQAVVAVLREGVEAAMGRYNAEAVAGPPEEAGAAT